MENPVNDGAHKFAKLWGLLSLLTLRVREHPTLLQTLLFTSLFMLLSCMCNYGNPNSKSNLIYALRPSAKKERQSQIIEIASSYFKMTNPS